MKLLLTVFLFVLLTACARAYLNKQQETPNIDTIEEPKMSNSFDALQLENYGPAPELTNQIWLNTDQPLRLANLRGKVVLLEMWTFG